jgi:hypothetical protein
MWAAGAAIVMCLALGGLPVAGQESSGSPAPTMPTGEVVFTGTATCGVDDPEEWLTSAPMVTGPCSITPTHFGGWLEEGQQISIPGAVGDYTVNGPEGDWTGTWLLIGICCDPPARNFMALEGTGAYEGWAVLAWAGTPEGWQGEPFDLQGIIYEGSTPRLEWSELVEPASE